MGNFRELKVWERSKNLAVYIYKLTEKGNFLRDFGLRDQMRRASVSIPSETFEKCSFLFKFKEGENFNRRNTLSISRIEI